MREDERKKRETEGSKLRERGKTTPRTVGNGGDPVIWTATGLARIWYYLGLEAEIRLMLIMHVARLGPRAMAVTVRTWFFSFRRVFRRS